MDSIREPLQKKPCKKMLWLFMTLLFKKNRWILKMLLFVDSVWEVALLFGLLLREKLAAWFWFQVSVRLRRLWVIRASLEELQGDSLKNLLIIWGE